MKSPCLGQVCSRPTSPRPSPPSEGGEGDYLAAFVLIEPPLRHSTAPFRRLLHLEVESRYCVGGALLDGVEQIYLKGFADIITGEVFDDGLDDDLILAWLPWLIWREGPPLFVVVECGGAG